MRGLPAELGLAQMDGGLLLWHLHLRMALPATGMVGSAQYHANAQCIDCCWFLFAAGDFIMAFCRKAGIGLKEQITVAKATDKVIQCESGLVCSVRKNAGLILPQPACFKYIWNGIEAV